MGQPHEDYRMLEPEYTAIAEQDFVHPVGTQQQIVPYARSLDLILQRHGTALIDEGLDPQIPLRFPKLINGYDVAASLKSAAITENSLAEAVTACTNESQEVRRDLLEYSEKAFAGNQPLLDQLTAIRQGKSYQDLSQDLMDLNTLLSQHRELFAPYKKFDPRWIDRAAELHLQLDTLLALKANPAKMVDMLKLRERQAMTLLMRSVDKIREYGELAFRKDKELLNQLKFSWKSRA